MKQISFLMLLFLSILQAAVGFVPPQTLRPRPTMDSQRLHMMDPISSSALILAETEAWVQPTAAVLDPFLNCLSLFMLIRVVLSWYPATNIREFPWIAIILPTEPLLRAVRGFIPPAFGVDITPIFWLAIFTFIHEILLGQQGLLVLKMKYGI
jgi:YggT family protein